MKRSYFLARLTEIGNVREDIHKNAQLHREIYYTCCQISNTLAVSRKQLASSVVKYHPPAIRCISIDVFRLAVGQGKS